MLIESSKDIFWLVLAFAVLWLTLFFSWMLYYIIKMMRQMSELTTKVSQTINLIHGMVTQVKSKSENLAAYISAIVQSSEQLKQLFGKTTAKNKTSKRGRRGK